MKKKNNTFVDQALISVEGGGGGSGCAGFHHQKYLKKGTPLGGDGGDGGNVVVVAKQSRNSLHEVSKKHSWKAKNGSAGGLEGMKGARGRDLEVFVPLGTVVYDESGSVVADLVDGEQRFVLARGGRGGRGNLSLSREVGKGAEFAEKGEAGQKRNYLLELKVLADVAIVGFPNSGKSTLLSRISNAKPRIADFPFTTLGPHLGVVEGVEMEFVAVDLPGLIEGAHEGKGMGHDFLKHVERAPVILYLLDVSPDTGRNPIHELEILVNELSMYMPELSERKALVVANKTDLLSADETLSDLEEECEKRELRLFLISALENRGLNELKSELERIVMGERKQRKTIGEEVRIVLPERENDILDIERSGDVFVVTGGFVERLVLKTDLNSPDAVKYLVGKLKKLGVDELLKSHGAKSGDQVSIAGYLFEYHDDEEI
ncbi:MAG: GTPase ObgE [Actinomycetota bacterium]|nr:GTPase ObgE [Actinomycetota bacterium]